MELCASRVWLGPFMVVNDGILRLRTKAVLLTPGSIAWRASTVKAAEYKARTTMAHTAIRSISKYHFWRLVVSNIAAIWLAVSKCVKTASFASQTTKVRVRLLEYRTAARSNMAPMRRSVAEKIAVSQAAVHGRTLLRKR